jgi:ribosomal protein L30E
MEKQNWETQALDRLKRALSHEKSNVEFISIRPKCRVFLGANESLRLLERREGALLVIPGKNPEALKQLLLTAADVTQCRCWLPPISAHVLAKYAGLKNTCTALAFSVHSDERDAFTSIRDFILKKLDEEMQMEISGKRMKEGS